MYSAFPLLCLCDLEQKGGEERGFEGIMWVGVRQFSRGAVEPSRPHAYNLQPGNFSFVNWWY